MPRSDEGLSRRALVASVAGGTALGAIWGAAFPVLAVESRPTLAMVGHRNAQLALLDSNEGRALILTGDPDDQLLERIPALMTLFRQRIDVLIGTQLALSPASRSLVDRWRIRHIVSIQSGSSAPAMPLPVTVVADAASIQLSADMTLQLRVGHRGEWISDRSSATQALWTITIVRGTSVVTLAADTASLSALHAEPSALVVVPEFPPDDMLSRLPASAVAANYDSQRFDEEVESPLPLVRTYPRDIARIVFSDDGIELPAWTKMPDGETTGQ